MLVIDFPFCLSKVFALYTSQTCIEPFLLGCYFSVATCFFVVTECVENAGVWMRFAVLPEAIWNWLGRSRPIFFFFLSLFFDPENVCINSHSPLEALLYYDSMDQYTLRTMNYDRWPDNCMKGLIGLSGNEVALWDFLFIKKDNLELSIIHYR